MNKRLIINADDFGLSEGVNKAVLQAHTEGVLTSATIMANMPAAEQACEIAKQLPTLGVGVHLNLVEGLPVSKDHSVRCLLGGDGRFGGSEAKLALLSLAGHKFRNAIRTEMAAQIQRVIDSGLKPTHLDSHKHIHCFPAIFTIVCELARYFQIPALRFALEPKELCQKPWPLTDKRGRKTAAILRIMARINRTQSTGFLKTDALFGVAHTGRANVSFFKAVASYNPVKTAEVMTHPGFANGLDPAKTRLLQQREIELEALCSEKTKRYFKDEGIELGHYGQL